MQFVINTAISALLIATAAELSRRSTLLAALLISLPATSIIALSLVYYQTSDIQKVSQLSLSIFWLVLPTLGFFLLLPVLLRSGMNFWLALALSCSALIVAFAAYTFLLRKLGISL